MDDKQVFSEKEAADLVLEAVRLQEQSSSSTDSYTPGISYTELLRIAGDVGVDEKYLREAVNTKKSRKVTENWPTFMGWPLSGKIERVVDYEISPDNFDIVEPEMTTPSMRAYGAAYIPKTLGRTITSTLYEQTYYANMKVSSRNGRTKIESQVMSYAYAFPVSLVIAGSGATMAALSKGGPASVAAIVMLLGAVAAWFGGQALARSDIRKAKERVDRIADLVLDEAASLDDPKLRDNLKNTQAANRAEQERIAREEMGLE